ncbi:MAG: hypothetical protein HQK76_02960 [Desulfobacterales bacterium]|nr:hypothetical protein [Desulfobacterales bacterium]
MQAIREIRNVKEGRIILNLPHIFWGQQVEIIILPMQDKAPRSQKSLKGCLQKYANPELIEIEKDAWGQEVEDKYVSC